MFERMHRPVTHGEPSRKPSYRANAHAKNGLAHPFSFSHVPMFPATDRLPWPQVPLQTKLEVAADNDPLEREADQVADRVMRTPEIGMTERAADRLTAAPHGLRRACARCEGEDERLRRAPASNAVAGQRLGGPVRHVPNIVHDVLRSGGRPLEATTRAFMEPRFGRDLRNVRLHVDHAATESARAVGALAYAVGRHVVVSEERYAPGTYAGDRLLAHELAHVLQQDKGDGGGGPLRRSPGERAASTCPGYETQEVERSHGERGLLPADVLLSAPGELLICDFGVDWHGVKAAARRDPRLVEWLERFETDSSYHLELVGYTDCVGDEGNNVTLRQARAAEVERLLGPQARTRVQFRGMAALGEYVTGNTTVEGRARNRGVVIRFHQEMTFPEERIEGHVEHCGPDVTRWLDGQMRANANHPTIVQARSHGWVNFVPGVNIGWNIGRLRDFARLVGTNRVWDFKSHWRALGWGHAPGHPCPTAPCERTVTMCGACWNYDVPGNIHFGYVGRQAAIPGWTLHRGADWAQSGSLFDDPKDAEAIEIGIRMADSGTGLCDELTAHRDQLNLEKTQGCPSCSEEPRV